MTWLRTAFGCTICFLVLVSTADHATAGLVYGVDLQRLGVPDPQGKLSVALVLHEVDDGLDASSDVALSRGSGLFGVGIRLERTAGDATLSDFRLADGFSPFGGNPTPNPTALESLWEFNVVSTNPFGDSPGFQTPQSTFTLGTVDITPGLQKSLFTLGNLSNPIPNNLSLGQNLSAQRADRITNYGSIEVFSVPEPAANGIVLMLWTLVCVFQRRQASPRTGAGQPT